MFHRVASLITFNNSNIYEKLNKLYPMHAKVLYVRELFKNEFLGLNKCTLDENINLDSDNELMNIVIDIKILYS